MPPKAESSTAYRNPTVHDDEDEDEVDDDDLDDLDDVLASFNKPHSPAKPPRSTTSSTTHTSQSPLNQGSSAEQGADKNEQDEDVDFDASLIEGMESLLRQLANAHPPGVMPDTLGSGSSSTTSKIGSAEVKGDLAAKGDGSKGDGGVGLSAEEEQKAWERAVEMMLSGEGLEAMGLGSKGEGGPAGPSGSQDGSKSATAQGTGVVPPKSQAASSSRAPPISATTSNSKTTPPAAALSFEETIRQSMASLDSASSANKRSGGAAGSGSGGEGDLAALLAQLQNDPSFLDSFGGGGDGEGAGDLGGLLDGMMSQLMTREVLEEPMAELASKYPAYLASPPPQTPKADLEKYTRQHVLVQQILTTFRKDGYSDDKDGGEIARLVGEMQDLGGPPSEIMGDLPEGFDLGALGGGGDDNCSIM